jgi:hypothetical protein
MTKHKIPEGEDWQEDELSISLYNWEAHSEAMAEIARLKALLTRAADALESPAWEWHKSWALAKELRKAAQ